MFLIEYKKKEKNIVKQRYKFTGHIIWHEGIEENNIEISLKGSNTYKGSNSRLTTYKSQNRLCKF